MSDKTEKLIDLLGKLLPVLTAVVGGIWALYAYIDHAKEIHAQEISQLAKDREARLVESQKPFLEKQLQLYFETVTVIGQLVSLEAGQDPDWAKARQQFWSLYWSELAMVESRDVESAMVQFGERLTDLGSKVDARNNEFYAARDELNRAALEVSHAIRSSIEGGWSVNH